MVIGGDGMDVSFPVTATKLTKNREDIEMHNPHLD